MPFKIGMRVEGTEKIAAAFATLKASLQKKHLRKAMNAAGKDVLWAARSETPKRTGILYKSLGRKVKVYKAGVVVAIVGARMGFRQAVGAYKRDSRPGTKYPHKAGEPRMVNPVKYLHLVELGAKRTQARRMLANALSRGRPAVQGYLEDAMQAAIAEAAAKGGA